jgi:hypothetical protein
MAPLDATTMVLLFAMLFHAFMLLYVIGMVLRPLVAAAVNGLINLAVQALDMQRVQTNPVLVPDEDK